MVKWAHNLLDIFNISFRLWQFSKCNWLFHFFAQYCSSTCFPWEWAQLSRSGGFGLAINKWPIDAATECKWVKEKMQTINRQKPEAKIDWLGSKTNGNKNRTLKLKFMCNNAGKKQHLATAVMQSAPPSRLHLIPIVSATALHKAKIYAY